MGTGALQSWILAARPKTLAAAAVPAGLGSVLAWWLAGAFSLSLLLCTLGSALAIQVATNFFNDYLDWRKGADTEARLGPQRVTASGAIPPRRVLALAAVMLVVASLLALPLIGARGWPILVIGVPSLYFAFGYTGGPVPLAYRGLGEFFVLLFFGWVAVAGTVFVQSGNWLWAPSLLLGTQVGLFSVALIAVNNLRDRDEDAGTGKRTLAVRFGAGFARTEIAVCLLLPLGLQGAWPAWADGARRGWLLLPLLLLPLALRVLATVRRERGRALNAALARCGGLLLGFGLLWSLGALLARG